jgi:hypothetical protein
VINMSSLSEQLLFTTVRIEAEDINHNLELGTGFLFHFAIGEKRWLPVIVTNRHVIKGSSKGRFDIHEALNTGHGPMPADSKSTTSSRNGLATRIQT